jgi:hypothetical protein
MGFEISGEMVSLKMFRGCSRGVSVATLEVGVKSEAFPRSDLSHAGFMLVVYLLVSFFVGQVEYYSAYRMVLSERLLRNRQFRAAIGYLQLCH